MDQLLEENKLQKIPFDDFENHPELVTNLLAQGKDVSILLRTHGDNVFVFSRKMYRDEVKEIIEEAKRLHKQKKAEGYSRELAFQDFMEAQQIISKYAQ
jgi:hypothetical protein